MYIYIFIVIIFKRRWLLHNNFVRSIVNLEGSFTACTVEYILAKLVSTTWMYRREYTREKEWEYERELNGRSRTHTFFFIVKIFSYQLNVDTNVHIYIFCNKHFRCLQLHFIYKAYPYTLYVLLFHFFFFFFFSLVLSRFLFFILFPLLFTITMTTHYYSTATYIIITEYYLIV